VKIPTFQVNAFTGVGLQGNPAAVCLLEGWLDDQSLQKLACENNVSETAFLVGSGSEYELRWFTPKVEVDLCGHATLASGFVIFSNVATGLSHVNFKTDSGVLHVEKRGDLLSMDFPARPTEKAASSATLTNGLGVAPSEVLKSRDVLAVFEDESAIRNMKPDFQVLSQVRDVLGIIVTAPGKSVDFVSRFFAPNAGIPEDPVTGSAHCTLVPYWAARLGKATLHAQQLSDRGGELFCEDKGERITISGRAVLATKAEISYSS
jgi:PhzF family phenazine biosynthesis protein